MACMPGKSNRSHASPCNPCASAWVGALMLTLSLGATGCLSSLHQHSLAVSTATVPVIDQADAAYHEAQRLHDLKVDYTTIETFEKTQTVDKAAVIEFPNDEAIHVRITVLEAFKCYVDSVVEITEGERSPQLEASARSVGLSLTSLGNSLAPTAEDLLHLAPPTTSNTTTYTTNGKSTTTTATVAAPLITTAGQNAVSTAVLALGEYLVARKVRKELPAKIKTMDKVLEALCNVLEDDIDIIQKQERRDLDAIYDSETLFLQSPDGKKLDGERRRLLIAALPEIIRKQRETDEQLMRLKAAIGRLYLMHHALAVDAQDSKPESLKAKIGDLSAAGNDLGNFYSSLPSK